MIREVKRLTPTIGLAGARVPSILLLPESQSRSTGDRCSCYMAPTRHPGWWRNPLSNR